ncbi:MAG: vWA domain-containing protein, partial [Candidatus Zixiibacteriota bacterium]
QFERSRKVALLLDHSASMDKIEADKSRQARVDSLLSTASFAELRGEVKVTPYYLGGNLTAAAPDVDREKTALGDGLYELAQQELADPSDAWMLLSDGRWNAGRDPAEAVKNSGVPVLSINVASGAGAFDVALTDIEYNPVVFAGQKTSVEATLNWQDAREKAVRVELRDSAQVLTTGRIAITQEVGQGTITLEYLPTEPGQQMLEVSIPPVAGEETLDNNKRTLVVKVLKSRLAVLIVSGHPDYEVGFLKRFLQQSGKYDVSLTATGSKAGNLAGSFPSNQTELNRYDLVILHDPDPAKLQPYQAIIRSYLQEKGGAVWLLMGQQFAGRGPITWINELLPFSQSGRLPLEYRRFSAQPSEGYLFHPAVRLEESQSAIRRTWNQLPPFQSLVRCDIEHSGGVILAYASLSFKKFGKLPVMGYRRHGPGKLFATAALPFWSWGFVPLGFGEESGYYGKFVEGVISWLTVRDDFDPIRIKPEKEVFARGETVTFEGFAYDLGYRPIPGVTGTVRMLRGGSPDTVAADLVSVGEGRYQARLFNLVPGTYRYKASFEKDGQLLKTSEGEILIESFSLEEFDQRGDPGLLMSLARLTGGDYFTYDRFDEALEKIERAPATVVRKGELVLWNRWWLMFAIIAALSIEWLLRKALQLV